MSITSEQYINYAITNRLIDDWSWVTSLLGVHADSFVNNYIKLENKKAYVYVDNDYIEYSDYRYDKSLLDISSKLMLSNTGLASLYKDIKTTTVLALINYIMIEVPFSGKIKYSNEYTSSSKILSVVTTKLSDGTINNSDYISFVNSCTYMKQLSILVTPSITKKVSVAPPGLKKFKSNLRKEFVSKYGKNWSSTPTNIIEYDRALKDMYEEYIKDDPSNNIIASKKNKGNALVKKYLTFGTTNAFNEQIHVDESLSDGYPTDPIKLAGIFNTTRAASLFRGAGTQKGGGVAKSVLRATPNIQILPGDCGVKYGAAVLLTKEMANLFLGRYVLIGNKIIILTTDNIGEYINTIVEMRSPRMCISDEPNLCSICVGSMASGYKNGVSLIVTNISATLTIASLKKTHNSQISSVTINLKQMLR